MRDTSLGMDIRGSKAYISFHHPSVSAVLYGGWGSQIGSQPGAQPYVPSSHHLEAFRRDYHSFPAAAVFMYVQLPMETCPPSLITLRPSTPRTQSMRSQG